MQDCREEIDFLEAYLIDEYDVFVVIDKDEVGGFCREDKVITINSSLRCEKRLFIMLHEAGHMLLAEDDGYDQRFPALIEQPYGNKFTQANAVDVVRNEVLAWEKGLELANNLGIKINLDKWNKFRKTNLHDYLKWSVGVGVDV
jgi:hypothetical protein